MLNAQVDMRWRLYRVEAQEDKVKQIGKPYRISVRGLSVLKYKR